MSLAAQVTALAARIATEVKANTAAIALRATTGYVDTGDQHYLPDPGEAATPDTYPVGMTITDIASGAWSVATSQATVVTFKANGAATNYRVVQNLTIKGTGDEYVRSATGTAPTYAWGAWVHQAPLDSPTFTGVPKSTTPAKFDSSTNIATTAYVTANAANQYQGATSGGSPGVYQRIAALDGVNATAGASITVLVAGLGDYGGTERGTAIVHLGQRGSGSGSFNGKVMWLTSQPTGVVFYSKNTGTYTFELWMHTANFQYAPQVTVLDTQNATLKMDSNTGTVPSGLVTLGTFGDLESVYNDVGPGGRLATVSQDISGTNLNSLTTTGFYRGQTLGSSPAGDSGWYWIICQQHDASWQSQIAFGYTSTGAGTMYYRYRNSGTWQAWHAIAPTDSPTFTGTAYAPNFTSGGSGASQQGSKFDGSGVTLNWQGVKQGRLNWDQPTGYVLLDAPLGPLQLTGSNGSGAQAGDLLLNNDGTGPRVSSQAVMNRTYSQASSNGVSSSTLFAVVTNAGTIGALSGAIFLPDVYTRNRSGQRAMLIQSDGSMGTSSSSIRVKNTHAQVEMTDAMLDAWAGVPTWTFDYKEDPTHAEHTGVIAEEVHAAGYFDDLIYYDERPEEEGGVPGQIDGFAYERMGVWNRMAIKRLLERVKELEARIPA